MLIYFYAFEKRNGTEKKCQNLYCLFKGTDRGRREKHLEIEDEWMMVANRRTLFFK